MARSKIGLFFIVLFAASPAFAQRPQTKTSHLVAITRDTTAIGLIQQSLTAMGLVASATVRTLSVGTITFADGNANQLKVETIGTDRIRHDIVDTQFTSVSNAGTGFQLVSGERQTLLPWVTKYQRPDHLPSLSLMADYPNSNLQIQYLGLEGVNGNLAHHLRLSMIPTDGTPPEIEDLVSEVHIYIDPASFMVVRIRTFDFSPLTPQNRSAVDTDFSDYRQQDGAQVPFHLIRYIAGQKRSEIAFTSISLNALVPDSDFQ
jgi:hypothetical protein